MLSSIVNDHFITSRLGLFSGNLKRRGRERVKLMIKSHGKVMEIHD